MDPGRFWHRPGIVAGLNRHGLTVLTQPVRQPPAWATEASHLGPGDARAAVTILAGSYGCSAAARPWPWTSQALSPA